MSHTTVDIYYWDAFSESEHPRGQPENAGEFAKGKGKAKPEHNFEELRSKHWAELSREETKALSREDNRVKMARATPEKLAEFGLGGTKPAKPTKAALFNGKVYLWHENPGSREWGGGGWEGFVDNSGKRFPDLDAIQEQRSGDFMGGIQEIEDIDRDRPELAKHVKLVRARLCADLIERSLKKDR